VDVESRKFTRIFAGTSDILSLCWDPETPHGLFGGSRDGGLLYGDYRVNPYHINLLCKQGKGLLNIKFMCDSNYVILSSLTGQVGLWDLRMRKLIFEVTTENSQNVKICQSQSKELLYSVSKEKNNFVSQYSLKNGALISQMGPLPNPIQAMSVFPSEEVKDIKSDWDDQCWVAIDGGLYCNQFMK
jgi:WD40 repeat protein